MAKVVKNKKEQKFVFISDTHDIEPSEKFYLDRTKNIDVKKIEERFQLTDVWFEEYGKKGTMIFNFKTNEKYVVCGTRLRKKLEDCITQSCNKTGIVYDERMALHRPNRNHPERPERIKRIWEEIEIENLDKILIRIPAREATFEELVSVHSKEYVEGILNECSKEEKLEEPKKEIDQKTEELEEEIKQENEEEIKNVEEQNKTFNRANDIYFNEFTLMAARLSAGSVIELMELIVTGKLDNGIAIVRPPGHHALRDKAMGFCFFNNVALAAQIAKTKYNYERILILDWDVHHGNGTEEIFLEDPNVLFISIHRFGKKIYPGTGDYTQIGKGKGIGRNVNIPFTDAKTGDAEYLYAFHRIILPIALEFNPQLVIVSAGFDAVEGDPLGGFHLSFDAFGYMCSLLKSLANGKILLTLEGGYQIEETAKCVIPCIEVLLGQSPKALGAIVPSQEGKKAVENVIQVQSQYWKCLELPNKEN